MAHIFDRDYSSTVSVRALYDKENADGTIEVLARVHGTLTAKTPYVVYTNYDGPRTLALFDTGLASTTAAGSYGFYRIGVPNAAISSDTDGWLQVGGYCGSVTTASITCTASNWLRWVDAAVAAGVPLSSVSSAPLDGFAIAYTSASATTSHNVMLLNRFVMGTT